MARRLIGALAAARPDLELVVYCGPEALDSLRAEPWAPRASFVPAPQPSRSKPRRVAAELTWLPARALRDRVELLHSLGTTAPVVSPVPGVVSVLDLIYHHFPETFPAASRLGLRVLVPAAARRARRVIALSHAGKRDLVQTLGLDPARIDVVHLGAGMAPVAEPLPDAELRARHRLGRAPVVLSVSAALRHKNLDRLLAAFARLRARHDATLVLVGQSGLDTQRLRGLAARLGVADDVRFTGWVEDRELEALYRAASVFVYPSLLEGFGLPLLEAMRRDVPVACSNASALPEVAGDAAELFDPYDEGAIAAAIERVLRDPRLRAELVARGRRRHQTFTWERAAEATLGVYERALSSPRATASPPARVVRRRGVRRGRGRG
jgi:glycosyltransferase involved in cell wall biosynthesis